MACSLEIIADYAGQIPSFLGESDVLDVCVNPDGVIWVNRLGRGFRDEGVMLPSAAALLLSGIATVRDCEFNEKNPILETVFPLTGDLIEGMMRPVVTESAFAIRTKSKQIYTLSDFAKQGVLTGPDDELNVKCHRAGFLDQAGNSDHFDVIRLATKYRQNVLLVGPAGSGKTTFGNAVIADWFEQTPGDRVVLIEDTPELQCALPNHVQLMASNAANEAALLKTALRLIPKRIVIGEVRAAEPARVLLEAWSTGHRGGLATLHADDAVSGLRKLESLIGSHDAVVRERIAGAIGLVIFIDGEERVPAGRKVRQVLAVRGFDAARQDYELLPL
jgi:Flp pilus assembly CpaF family ATPase